MLKKVVLIMFVCFIGLGNVSIATEIAKSHKMAAESLFNAMDMNRKIQELREYAIQMELQRNRQMKQYNGVLRKFYSKYISYDTLKNDLVRIYTGEFNEKELNQLSVFFSSKIGQKYSKRQLELYQIVALLAQDKANENAKELRKMLDAEAGRLEGLHKDPGREPSGYQEKALDAARKGQTRIEKEVQKVMDQAREVALSMAKLKSNKTLNRKAADDIVKEFLEKNPDYLAVWVCMEPNELDNMDLKNQNAAGHDKSWRYKSYWNRLNGKIEVVALTI